MIPFPANRKVPWFLLVAFSAMTILTPLPISMDLLGQATFGLIGVFGGIAVAAALVYLAKARDLLSRSVADYGQYRKLTPAAESAMRRSMDKSVKETKENILIIIGCGFFNFLLLALSETQIPYITNSENSWWSHRTINILGCAAIISSLYAVWDTVAILSVAHELEGELDQSRQRSGIDE